MVETTSSHVASLWGSSLPVMVTEVLTLSGSGGGGEVTVRVGEQGWAWLVSGRRLVVWRVRPGGGRAQCRELSLPPSDLAHRADLCLVGQSEGGQTPHCLAVSPEGVVRFWPSIAQEGTSTEISAELGGQECYRVTDIQPVGCLVSTTTASLVLIHQTAQGIVCRRLAAPAGLLGGLGRRVSSLLWGAMPAGGGEGRMVGVGARTGEDEVGLYVLTSTGLQRWQVGVGEPDRFYYECDVTSLAREAAWSCWPGNTEQGSAGWLRVWLVDLAVGQEGHSNVLVAANNQHDQSNSVLYFIVQFRTLTAASPISYSGVTPVSSLTYNMAEAGEPKQYRLIRLGDWCYVYSKERVTMVNLAQGEDSPAPSHISCRILGVGQADNSPLFFSSQHGVISLTPRVQEPGPESPPAPDTSRTKLCDSLNVSVSAAGLENLTMSESLTDQLKAAFLLHCKRSTGQAQSIVEELFPLEQSAAVLDSTLDRLVVGLSRDLIDDFPASDPRWVESLPQSGNVGYGSSNSLLVLHQLEDKLACHQYFISFLKSVGLWSRLTGITDGGSVVSTSVKLAGHAEKTVAAVTLRTIHLDHSAVIDQAIKTCLAERDVNVTGNLTDQDHFYREISRIDDILAGLVGVARYSIRSDCPRDLVSCLLSVNTVVLTTLKESLAARNKRLAEFQSSGQAHCEYLPWTSARRLEMMEVFKLTLEHGVPAAEGVTQRQRLYQQLVELADIVLDSYGAQLDSLTGRPDRQAEVEKSLERDRSALVGQLVDRKCYDEAAGLAEKFRDWDLLVRICEETKNREKLESYMERFSDTAFSSHVYAWYVKEGKQNRLLSLSKTRHSPDLTSFLTQHSHISWLHDIQTNNFSQAADTLTGMAMKEGEILARKKLQLSLAKLAALACEPSHESEEKVSDDDDDDVDDNDDFVIGGRGRAGNVSGGRPGAAPDPGEEVSEICRASY